MIDDRLHIMFVDDNEDVLKRMKIIVEAYPDEKGIQFYLHLTQGGALRMLHMLHYLADAVIIDLSLQDGSGRELTSLIRKKEQNYGHKNRIKIFWFTGRDVNLDDPIDPITQTYFASRVSKIYRKGIDDEIDMVQEIIDMVTNSNHHPS